HDPSFHRRCGAERRHLRLGQCSGMTPELIPVPRLCAGEVFRRRETLNEQLLREAQADAARRQAPGTASLDSASDKPSFEPGSGGADGLRRLGWRIGLRRSAQFKHVEPEPGKSQEWQDWWTSWGRRDLRRVLIEEWGPTEADTGDEYEEDLDPLGAQLRDGA